MTQTTKFRIISYIFVGVVIAGALWISGPKENLGGSTKRLYPNKTLTPGAINRNVTKNDICEGGTKALRNVPTGEKDQVYARYNIKTHTPGQYEIDHYVPLSLGGSNEITNLWPEPAEPRPGFKEKDRVELYLYREMCAGRISLNDARTKIWTDWHAVYQNLPLRGVENENPDGEP